jgi:hypothetical protein
VFAREGGRAGEGAASVSQCHRKSCGADWVLSLDRISGVGDLFFTASLAASFVTASVRP